MSRRFPPPRSRPRSHTAKALEIVRLTKRPKASSGGWPSAVEISALQYLAGQRYAAQWRAYLATLDGPRSPQARPWARKFLRRAVPQPATSETAPVSSPGAPGSVPAFALDAGRKSS